MTIQEHVKDDLKASMISKKTDIRDILRVVIGEFNRKGKEVDDKTALAIIKKMAQNAEDQTNTVEKVILEAYLPDQLDQNELTIIITNFCKKENYFEMKFMGKVMAHLKSNYDGLYNGKDASNIVKIVLS